MNATTMSSHAASGVLHALLLLIAFLSPVTLVLDDSPTWIEDVRMTRIVETDIVVETGFRTVEHTEVFSETGRGGAPGDGEGDSDGARAGTLVESEPSSDDRSLRASTLPALVDDVEGILAGFADDQLGPDTETALGALDDGGGRDAFGGMGTMGGGGGATCGAYWKTRKDGTTVHVKTDPCEGIRLARGWGRSGMIGRSGKPVPDLGEKGEASVVPTVIAGQPAGCFTAAQCPWKEIIGKVIRRHKRELKHCYDQALDRHQRAFDASVDLSFAIPPAGGTATVELAASSGVAELDNCVQQRVARWIFPDSGLSIRANYPFRFAVL